MWLWKPGPCFGLGAADLDIERDRVSVRGEAVTQATYTYVVMNKPAGLVTTRSDERGRPTVFDVLAGADLPHLSAVGRLDLESEGLLLFTNDTEFAQILLDPQKEKMPGGDAMLAESRLSLAGRRPCVLDG